MRICKRLRKRGLALFMALVMSLSLLPVTAMAEGDDHVHNADGWECTRVDPVTESDCQHKEHTPDCGYAAAVEEIPCDCGAAAADEATGEVIHADGCAYTPAVEEQPCTHKCGDECTKVVAPEHWNCTAPVAAETPAGVQAFLDAAALLPDASLVTEETVETVDAQAASALALYAALGVELQAREDVIAAKAAVDAVQAAVQTVRESQVPEVPAEVQTFLDKVKDLPEAALVTAENVEIVDAQVTDALALYGSLGELQVREDVAAALVTVEAVRAAVRAVKESEVPAEVQAFLDAVEALPKAEEVTRENVTAIGEQVKVVLDMYESLTEAGLDEADGVAEALAIACDILVVVTEVSETLGNNESTTWDGESVSDSLDKGSGTEEDPYLIENAADLAYLAQLTWEKAGGNNKTKDQYYKLTADIDLDRHEWTPIGGISKSADYSFQGHFIGGGHTISSLIIINPKPDENGYLPQTVGLFGSIANGAEICDLKLNDVTISRIANGKYPSGYSSGAGALVGVTCRYGSDRNLICNVTVSNASISWDQYAGGITGSDQAFTNIKKCCVRDSKIAASSWGAGGIIGGLSKGQRNGTTYVTECSSKGCDISSKYGAVGGIVGYCGSRTGSQDVTGSVIIKGCYNTSAVSYWQVQFPDKSGVMNYPAGAGGIIGYSKQSAIVGRPGSNGVAIHNCTNYGTITAPAGSSMYGNSNGKGYAGGIVGYGMGFSIHFIGKVNNLDLNINFPDPDCNIPIKGCHNAGEITTRNRSNSNKSYVVLANLIGYPYSSIIPADDARLSLRKAFYLEQGNSFVSGLIDGSYATVKTACDSEYATPVDTAEQFTPIDPCPGPAGGCTCGCHCTWHEGDGPDGPDVEPPKVDYTLVYDANGGVFEYNAKTKTDTESGLKDAMYVTFDVRDYTPIWENHTFLGWATTSNATEAQYKYNESGKDTVTFSSTDYMVLYAVWRCALSITKTASNTAPKVGEEFTYTLKVSNPNSEAVSANITDTLDEKLTYVSSSDSGVHTDGTGTDGKNGGTVTWTNIEVSANSNRAVTLTVKANTAAMIENTAKVTWPGDDTGKTSDPCTITATAKEYNVTFDVNGGKETIPDQQVEDGGKAIKPDDPTKDGYTFVKWTLNGSEYNFDTPVTDNITLVAQYTPDEAKIVFVTNGGSTVENMTGVTDQVINNTTMPATIREGFVFDGWYDNEPCTGTPVTTLPDKFPAGTTTYYAKWTEETALPNPPVIDPGFVPSTPTPTAPTPTPAPNTTITDDETPLAGSVGLNDTDHFAYVIGYEDDTVRPLNNITRAEAATIFFRLMTDEYRQANWSTTNSFSDVNVGDWYNNAVSTCANAGVLKGYEDGTFRPNAPITRAEFATMAAGFMDEAITDDGTGDFSDTANHWAAVAIRRAAKAGWVTGNGNKFNPDAKITRAEVMTIVNRMLDRTPDKDHMLPEMKKWTDNPESEWYYEAVQEATNEHEYERDELNVETWTELLTVRDWKALETEWANNGGASAPKADDTEAAQRMNRVPDGI